MDHTWRYLTLNGYTRYNTSVFGWHGLMVWWVVFSGSSSSGDTIESSVWCSLVLAIVWRTFHAVDLQKTVKNSKQSFPQVLTSPRCIIMRLVSMIAATIMATTITAATIIAATRVLPSDSNLAQFFMTMHDLVWDQPSCRILDNLVCQEETGKFLPWKSTRKKKLPIKSKLVVLVEISWEKVQDSLFPNNFLSSCAKNGVI